MKKIVAALVMMVVMNGAFGQDAISKFFSKYQNDESFSQVTVSSKMFGLFTNMEAETPEDKEVLDAISKLKGLRILGKEDARNARELYKEAFTLIPMKEYEELMSVTSPGFRGAGLQRLVGEGGDLALQRVDGVDAGLIPLDPPVVGGAEKLAGERADHAKFLFCRAALQL
jgi:hypothetical protein